jgi:hypothetical protein
MFHREKGCRLAESSDALSISFSMAKSVPFTVKGFVAYRNNLAVAIKAA